MLIRDANPSDFDPLLQLNEAFVHFLSPLTREQLARLYHEAAYCRVVVKEEVVGAFLLAFREGCSYDSPNYRWFCDHFDSFLYIDRIVVAREYQGLGVGALLYADLFSFARQTRAPRVACEFDINPPNEASRRFHERFGFKEVGTQTVAAGKKQVSLQIASLSSTNGCK
jgi:predicted GNAT superfamily acetyltransferase